MNDCDYIKQYMQIILNVSPDMPIIVKSANEEQVNTYFSEYFVSDI